MPLLRYIFLFFCTHISLALTRSLADTDSLKVQYIKYVINERNTLLFLLLLLT